MGNSLDVLCSTNCARPGHSARRGDDPYGDPQNIERGLQRQKERLLDLGNLPRTVILAQGVQEGNRGIEGIKLTVYQHEVNVPEKVMCRSFVTSGLALYGHMEIILTVKLERGENPVKVPCAFIELFQQITNKAMEGYTVSPGSFSAFSPFLRPYLRGAVYAPSNPDFPVLPLDPYPQLCMLLAYPEELEYSSVMGSFRVLNRLASTHKYFPYPVWNNLDRKAVVTEQELRSGDSVLMHGPVFRFINPAAPRAYLDRDTGELCVFIDHAARAIWKDAFKKLDEKIKGEPSFAFSIPTYPHWEMDSSLYWFPNRPGPTANVGPWESSHKLNGCHLLICIDRKLAAENVGKVAIIEDGFGLVFTPAQWKNFQDIVVDGGELQFDKLRFVVRKCEEVDAPFVELRVGDEDLERIRNWQRMGGEEEDGHGPELPPVGTSIFHPQHPHKLVVTELDDLELYRGGFGCDICGRCGKGKSFHCNLGCDFDVCARCGNEYVKDTIPPPLEQQSQDIEDSCS